MNTANFKTPGQYLEALMGKREWSGRVLSIIIGCQETKINKVINGHIAIDADLALTLGEIFGVEPEDFLTLQKKYDLAKAKIKRQPDQKMPTRMHLFGGLPISDMIKRGWLSVESIKNISQVEAELASFFEVASVDEIEILPHAAKKTMTFSPVTPAQLAWLYRVKKISHDMLTARFSEAGLSNAIENLKLLLHSPEEIRKVPRILAECGIRFLIVEALPSTKIDGVCFWINNQKPVVAMTLRYDRIDNFWFVLRHELEHVRRKHGQQKIMIDFELEGERAGISSVVGKEEQEANQAAIDFCIPQAKMDSFIARKSPFFKEIDMLGFANTLHIHPGIVAGQLQHRTGRYDRFRSHLVKVRHIISPNAMVDGWGDIAPID